MNFVVCDWLYSCSRLRALSVAVFVIHWATHMLSICWYNWTSYRKNCAHIADYCYTAGICKHEACTRSTRSRYIQHRGDSNAITQLHDQWIHQTRHEQLATLLNYHSVTEPLRTVRPGHPARLEQAGRGSRQTVVKLMKPHKSNTQTYRQVVAHQANPAAMASHTYSSTHAHQPGHSAARELNSIAHRQQQTSSELGQWKLMDDPRYECERGEGGRGVLVW